MQIGPIQIGVPESASYGGAVASIGASLTLTQPGVLVGIFTALATFAVSTYFSYRKDRREERVARERREERLLELKAHIKGEKWQSDSEA